MNLYITWIQIINEYICKEQGTDDDGPNLKKIMIAEDNVILDTPQKPKKLFQFETPDTNNQDLSWFKDTFLCLSPATQKFHDIIERQPNCQKLSTIHGHWMRCKKHYWLH